MQSPELDIIIKSSQYLYTFLIRNPNNGYFYNSGLPDNISDHFTDCKRIAEDEWVARARPRSGQPLIDG
ncbi:MAG: hypothetical protein P9L94_05940 [Candidatus Hinthialibacter antarcticus]|nr:hypothetical protein [Candidatus Hinthialibacter antarcticus]